MQFLSWILFFLGISITLFLGCWIPNAWDALCLFGGLIVMFMGLILRMFTRHLS